MPAMPATATPPAYRALGWRVNCSSNASQTLDCQAVQQVVQNASNQTLVAMTVRVPAGAKQPVMLIQIPLGISIGAGVKVGAGSVPLQTLTLQTCTQAGCFAGGEISSAMMAAMRSGQSIRIIFSSLNKQAITVTIPATGFEAAYAKLR